MQNVKEKSLKGRTLYVHPMTTSGSMLLSACMRSLGVDAYTVPPSDARTLELGNMHSSGEECLPEKITIGDYLKITELPGFDPAKTAFFMPTANGPCRFGQYEQLLKGILRKKGLDDVMVMSPSSENGYSGIGGITFFKTAWLAIISADILRKMLLKTRPYEKKKGSTDNVYQKSLSDIEKVFGMSDVSFSRKLKLLIGEMENIRDNFRSVDAEYIKGKPLLGVVGEIFCRLNKFANDEMIRKLEDYGAETWLADVGEWVVYTDWSKKDNLRRQQGLFSLDAIGVEIKSRLMKSYEHRLIAPFHDDFEGYEEPESTDIIVKLGEPYLPAWGALGEMALSAGRSVYLQKKGADGIVDISPFSCMNGIVTEAVYPSISRDHNGIPCRVFFYDGINVDFDRDIGIFMELVRGYMSRKLIDRKYPKYFK